MLVKPAVRAQPAYALAPLACRRKLNQNEAATDLPAALKDEILARAAAAEWHRYPEFVPAALLEGLGRHYGADPEGVLAGNGSNEIIQAALAVTIGPGDVVVAPTPTFSLYRLLTSVMGGRYVPVPFAPGFVYDVDALVAVAQRERARVVVLNSPNNPTGSAAPAGTVERLLAETDALLLVDEAYQEFGGTSAIPLLARDEGRLVVLRTFSKALGMAGLRFGVGLAAPALAREIAKAKLPYNVNLVTLIAAETLLAHAGLAARRAAETVALRDRTIAALRGSPLVAPVPSAANFFLLHCTGITPRDLFARLLEEEGILLRDVSGVPELHDCLRVSVGTAADMDALVDALRRFAA